MAFLGLTDIKFVTPDKRTNTSNIPSLALVYPRNLGTTDRGHYVIFHVNEFASPESGGVLTTAQKNAQLLSTKGGSLSADSLVKKVTSSLSSLSSSSGPEGTYIESDPNVDTVSPILQSAISNAEKLGVKITSSDLRNVVDVLVASANRVFNPAQRYRRTQTSIALYMPNTLNFDYQQTYRGISGTETLGKVGVAVQAGSNLVDTGLSIDSLANKKSFIGEAIRAIVQRTGNLGGFVGQDFGELLQQAGFGAATNPQVEMLYSNPELRRFDFTFVFYPESAQEYRLVDEIITTMKYYSAPTIQANSYGRYFTPPGSFDIEFMYNGLPNKNIPKISTCVLETIQVNYAPNGFSAYELNPGEGGFGEKGDGAPTSVSMTLAFREMEIMHRDLLNINQSNDGNTF